jgi:regulator of sigma E protease
MIVTLLVFVGSLLVLIGFHEAGHFLAAKAFGVYVVEFAIGFGPRLLTFRGKETRYSIRVVPFGGYVRMAGEDRRDDGSDISENRRLYSKPPLVRAAISLAGPAMNLILSILVTVAVVWSYDFPILQVAGLVPGGPAEEVLVPGDRVLRVDGVDVFLIDQITDAIQASEGEGLSFEIRRGDGEQTVGVRPEFVEEEDRYIVGAYFHVATYTSELQGLDPVSTLGRAGLRDGDVIAAVGEVRVSTLIDLITGLQSLDGPLTLTAARGSDQIDVWVPDASELAEELAEAVPFADLGLDSRHTGFAKGVALGAGQFAEYVSAMGNVLGGIVTGRVAAGEALRGPVGVAQELGKGFRMGPIVFFQLLGFLSLNFGLLNLIPFPGLDGSRIAFALYERIRGRPIPVEREGLIHAIGFVVLIALMILITYKDLAGLFR